MAYREVSRMEIKEIIRRWQAGDVPGRIAFGTGLSRNTVRKYLAAAQAEGIAQEGPPPSEEQLVRLATISLSGPRQAATPRQDQLEPWSDQIYQWITKDRLLMTRIHELLGMRGCQVSYPSLRRFIINRNWRRRSKTTVRMADTPPGEVAEADFGRLGMITDPATGKRKAVWAMVIVMCHSRHCFVWPMMQHKLPDVIAGLEAAWAFVPRQPDLPNCRRLVLPVHPLGRSSLAALLCCVSPVARDVEFQDDGVVDHPVNRRGSGHGVGEDALPLGEDQVGRDAQGPAFVAFCNQGEEDLGLLVAPVSSTGQALGEVAQVVQKQEVEVVQLAQLSGQGEVPLGGQQILHQAVGRGEEDGVAGFHQAVAQGAERVGLAGAGEPESQHVDAVFHEAALGQLVDLLSQRQWHPVVIESFPGLARGELGCLTQPVDAPVAAILGFLLQHFEKGGQSIAVASLGETGHRLGAHGGHLELVAELADALLHHAGVGVHHPHTPDPARLTVSRPS